MKKLLITTLLCLTAGLGFAQSDVYLNINHFLGNDPFQLNQAAFNNNNVKFDVSRLEYYISEVVLIHDGGTETAVPNTWLIVDGSAAFNELLGNFPITSLEGVRFGIGVDSVPNHGDPALWPSTHPLAPRAPSMHWGWASGYRFVAMEGNGGQDLNQMFQIHALEDFNYFYTTIMTSGTVSGSDITIDLDADYAEAVRDIDVSSGIITHGGYDEAVTCLENFRDHVFSAASSSVAVEPEATASSFSMQVGPNPLRSGTIGTLRAEWKGKAALNVTDIQGRVLQTSEFSGGTAEIMIEAPGIYFVTMTANSGARQTQKILVTD